jgi:glucan phosphoethanolaminetransferase (alkaline phosphatase superfamily)
MLFIFLSIFATALGRSGFGVEQALSSRYKILSVVLLVLIYLSFLEIYPKQFSKKLLIYCLIFLAVVFNIGSTKMSIHNMVLRKNNLIEGITTWKNTGQGLAYPDQKRASFLLNQSIEKGIYYPPN